MLFKTKNIQQIKFHDYYNKFYDYKLIQNIINKNNDNIKEINKFDLIEELNNQINELQDNKM